MATNLGLLHLELAIPDAFSLKDKRRLVKGLKDRLAARFNVSVAEVDAQDERRRAVLAVAMVGNDHGYVEGALQQVANLAENTRGLHVTSCEVEFI